MIYTGAHPETFANETLTNKPIRIIPIHPHERLAESSRGNYAKIYAIEHTVRVQFIGRIDQKGIQQVVSDFNRIHSVTGPQTGETMS